MSFILTLDENELGKIIPLLSAFEDKIAAAAPIFNLDGRRLEEIAKTLPQHQSSYDRSYNEIKGLEEWVNNIKDKRVSVLWRKYNENYSRALSAKDIQMYIAGEKDIVELNQIIIEVSLLKNNLYSITEALKSMSWMVSHITKIRVAELQETVL